LLSLSRGKTHQPTNANDEEKKCAGHQMASVAQELPFPAAAKSAGRFSPHRGRSAPRSAGTGSSTASFYEHLLKSLKDGRDG
jgi:hypothetical protein